MVKIEKKIPIPEYRSKYPFASMEVGDSFYMEIDPQILSSAAWHWSRYKNNESKFKTRKEGKGARCWRIK